VGKESETWTCSMSLLHLCAPLYCSSFDQSMQKKRLCEIKTTFVSFVLVLFLSMSIVFSKCGCCPKCLCCVVKYNSMEKGLETFDNWKKSIIVLAIRRFFRLNSYWVGKSTKFCAHNLSNVVFSIANLWSTILWKSLIKVHTL